MAVPWWAASSWKAGRVDRLAMVAAAIRLKTSFPTFHENK